MTMPRLLPAVLAALLLTACGEGDETRGAPGDPSDTAPFARIAEDDTIRFTGTEPFWGGRIEGAVLTYETPENIEGSVVSVTRFAGRGGVSFSGELDGARFDIAISEGACSDGMSDRTYPFHAALRIGTENRFGCAWSGEHPFTGPENP